MTQQMIGVMIYGDKKVVDRYGKSIRDFAVLPRITSIDVKGLRIEFWFRMDPRATARHVISCMPVKTVDGQLMSRTRREGKPFDSRKVRT